ncbi:hypothetical protein Pyrfu_1922 [Pyrolobus fumarii 1A]|uniref:Uncharacterized protein n=1 Tax=Pyrolobus fumarii (strain DSM 11204 / 1A) TaxID=694429 RepID=G0ED97_PYRF1|nr:hypothetical protein [Pyrolobus fumarii]AEM39775.1 hypothetical protein Pyrfu_1922 [Pyrolobus fumarii 1A]
MLLLGAILLFLGIPFLSYGGVILLLAGLALAWYGWKNRYILEITAGSKKFSTRNGERVHEIAARLRGFVMQVKQS